MTVWLAHLLGCVALAITVGLAYLWLGGSFAAFVALIYAMGVLVVILEGRRGA